MSQVSKRLLSKEISDKIVDLFNDSLNIKNSKFDRSRLLEELLTSTEKIMLIKRVAIGVLYSAGYDYRGISDILKVSTTTARNYIYLYKQKEEYYKTVNKLHKDERTKASIEKLIYVVSNIFNVGGSKSGFWKVVGKDFNSKYKNRF